MRLGWCVALAWTLASVAASNEPIEIHFAVPNVNYKPAFEAIIERYEAERPDVRVKLSVVTQNYETWIRTKFAGGLAMAPDIYNGNVTPSYGKQGKWVALNPHLEAENRYTGRPWRETMDMALLRHYEVSGRIYGIALDFVEIGIVYNRDIFDELDLEPPRTWEELLDDCERIQQAGYIPFAVPGDTNSFYMGVVGWIVRFFSDAYCRDLVPLFMARPGDWDYDPQTNAEFELDLGDRFNDTEVVINEERQLLAFRQGLFRFDSPRFKAMYRQLKRFSRYWQPGYAGTDPDMANQLFLRQRAAMIFEGSHIVIALDLNMRDLLPEDRFRWDVMPIPPITEDPHCLAPFRGVGGAGTFYVVTDKRSVAPERVEAAIDFLQFLASPQSGSLLVRTTLANDLPLIGPPAILDVGLPEELERQFETYRGRGFEKVTFIGLAGDQESIFDWTVLAQEYFAGRLELEPFLRQYQEAMERAVPRIAEDLSIDWNPATRDDEGFETAGHKSPWNPFANGGLMVLLLGVAIGGGLFASHLVSRRRYGAQYTSTTLCLLAPTFLTLIAFNYYPALSGLYHAFTDWEEGRRAVFTGLANFRRMLDDIYLARGLGNLALLIGTGIVKATVVPFIVAELLFGLRSARWRGVYRTAFLVPMVAPGIVVLLIWRFIYDPSMGLLNNVLGGIEDLVGVDGLTRVWLGEPQTALGSIIFMGFPWVGAMGLLLYLAGLQQIGESVHDAFRIDSSSLWARIRYVDLPMVAGQTKLLIVLAVIQVMQEFFTILLLTDGGPGMATQVPALRMYHTAFRFSHFGYGAAIGFMLFAVILVLTLINMKMWKTEHHVA